MDNDSNFDTTRRTRAFWASHQYFEQPAAQNEACARLRSTFSARPEAVMRARILLSDPAYPSDEIIEQLALYLAGQLEDEADSLPS